MSSRFLKTAAFSQVDSEEEEDDEDYQVKKTKKKRGRSEYIIEEAEVDDDAEEDEDAWVDDDEADDLAHEAEEAGRTARDIEARSVTSIYIASIQPLSLFLI